MGQVQRNVIVPESLVSAQEKRWADLFRDDRIAEAQEGIHDDSYGHRTAKASKEAELPENDPVFLLDPNKCGQEPETLNPRAKSKSSKNKSKAAAVQSSNVPVKGWQYNMCGHSKKPSSIIVFALAFRLILFERSKRQIWMTTR